MTKNELHLKADNEQEAAIGRLSCFVDVSRNGIQLLKLNDKFKALEFVSCSFPHASTDAVWAEHVRELLDREELANAISSGNCKYSISDNQVMIIPETLFSESEKAKYIDFLFNSDQGSEVISQKISNVDAIGLFSIPNRLKETLKGSASSSFLTWTDSILGISSGIKAYLILEEKQFSLTILKEGKLQFSNWFQHAKSDDVLYFLMATLESLNILHSDVELVLAGAIEKGDETFNILSRFIAKTSFLKRPKNLTYSYSFSQLPEHRFPFIFAAACA